MTNSQRFKSIIQNYLYIYSLNKNHFGFEKYIYFTNKNNFAVLPPQMLLSSKERTSVKLEKSGTLSFEII